MDTVNLAPNESLDLIMDFTDPIIRGVVNISLTISPDGTVATGGSRSGFPSLEAWSYQPGQPPTNILAMQETTLSDLGSLNQPIPDSSVGETTVTTTEDDATGLGAYLGGGPFDDILGYSGGGAVDESDDSTGSFGDPEKN
jgi:hypothetical protein